MDFFRNFFKNPEQDPMPLDEAMQILDLAETQAQDDENKVTEKEEAISEERCFEGTGTVTMVCERYGILDKQLYFEHSDMSKIKLGMKLVYSAYMDGDVTKVNKILYKKDLDWKQPASDARPYSERTLQGQVIDRRNRLVIVSAKPDVLEIDLNNVETEFIPIIGDWVQLDVTVEVDEHVFDLQGRVLCVHKIIPSRTKVDAKGVVTFYDGQSEKGIINTDISFSKDSCAPGFVPIVNDKVSYEAIESNQGVCVWRALKVVPSEKTNSAFQVVEDIDNTELLENKNGIVVSEQSMVNLHRIGAKYPFALEVHNNGTTAQTIISYSFHCKHTQLFVKRPTMENTIEIQPKQCVLFSMMCQAKYMGSTNEVFIIHFQGFKIGRLIKIQVAPPFNDNSRASNKSIQYKNSKNISKQTRDSILNNRKNILPGDRPMKAPAFVTIKLPMFHIPERLAEIYFKEHENNSFRNISGEMISKSLIMDLSIQNYEDRFHALLYVEEISIHISMRRFDMDRACFVADGDYLKLEVPDLSDRRPSIIIGDRIIASNPKKPEHEQFEGYVHKTGSKHVYLKFAPAFHRIYSGQDYAIQFYSSRTNFRRYHQAIHEACRNLGRKFLFPTSVPTRSVQVEFTCEDEFTNIELSNLLALTKSVSKNLNKPVELNQNSDLESKTKGTNSKIKRMRLAGESANEDKESSSSNSSDELVKPKLQLEWFDKKLNHFQKAAVINILKGEARPLPYLIFGPPGTGKTITLIETILQILRLIPNSRLIVTAPSNSAADLIALRLLDSGVLKPGDLVRMVAYSRVVEGKIPQKLIPFSVTGDIAREGTREVHKMTENGVNLNVQLSSLGRHRITIATCTVVATLYNMGFPKEHFTHIIIDEAGQALEPEIMIPLSLLDIKSAQTILAGDPLQLGPYVYSLLSKQYGLGESFFERLMNRFPYVRDPTGFPESGGYDPRLVTRLAYNYRSLPEILHLPNTLFYNSELIPVISPETSEEAKILQRMKEILPKTDKPLPPSVIFHGVRGENYQTSDSPSWFNPVEAGQVFYYVSDLYRIGMTEHDIGIISPYLKQCQRIRSLLGEANLALPKIGSVEEFQGQEFKVIILSTVRSNESEARNDANFGLGFISTPPRLNVAISRAQVLLIIVGNPHLLIMDNYWRSVLIYSKEIGGYIGCNFPNIR